MDISAARWALYTHHIRQINSGGVIHYRAALYWRQIEKAAWEATH